MRKQTELNRWNCWAKPEVNIHLANKSEQNSLLVLGLGGIVINHQYDV